MVDRRPVQEGEVARKAADSRCCCTSRPREMEVGLDDFTTPFRVLSVCL